MSSFLRISLIYIVIIFSIPTAWARQPLGSKAIPPGVKQALAKQRIPLMSLGLAVLDPEGRPLLMHQADKAFNPASTMKLLTTFAALDLLGPAHQWRTELWSTAPVVNGVLKGDLYIKGQGDPKLTIESMWLLLRKLRAAGIHTIEGRLVQDRTAFGQVAVENEAQFDEQPERAYNVKPDALLINFKAVGLDIQSDSQKIVARYEPALFGVALDNQLALVDGDCELWRSGMERVRIEGRRLLLAGRFPRQCHQLFYTGLLTHFEFDDLLIRALWSEMGGKLIGEGADGRVPAEAHLIAAHASSPLAELVRDINKVSNNVMARQLFLGLGVGRDDTQPLRTNARLAVESWLHGQNLRFPELVLENGSGLSRSEQISPAHLASLLQLARNHRYGPELMASLPIAGVDGTLRRHFVDTGLASEVRAKTGSLDNVRALAGYVRDRQGRGRIMVAMINHDRAEAAWPVFEALAKWVASGGSRTHAR
ncbi:D-alanyl-D-alanine carboxypeptidase/D-alanyl-D-alanine endopeptidase [Parachitinimonas caeni]|uniref:D-alanyl-D-alanine carboxypeptidase/D-alanyl-D-alanine-endopeptidase n=1 Tax=Parachitinimonas caeni TaxID=3031301 RepID=A0ABT7DT75_9NEIS|nr:D-alanyl-D-alanine carboxypeptidase/D-alanyl-D-alanine-endopeptidase [Parachitinimonas caeni]MDK2123287.1 D-alanyl-D-alanine carboxypeptidase/D-alanyl-D-alanine-endopeptidase [Parachitinimonas caeni]